MFAKSFGDLGQILGAVSGGCLGNSPRKVCKVLERFEPHSGGALGDCLADRSGVLANSLDICWTLVTFLEIVTSSWRRVIDRLPGESLHRFAKVLVGTTVFEGSRGVLQNA